VYLIIKVIIILTLLPTTDNLHAENIAAPTVADQCSVKIIKLRREKLLSKMIYHVSRVAINQACSLIA